MYSVKFALFQVYTYSGLLLLILLAEFGAGIAALVRAIFYLTIFYLKTWYVPFVILQYTFPCDKDNDLGQIQCEATYIITKCA